MTKKEITIEDIWPKKFSDEVAQESFDLTNTSGPKGEILLGVALKKVLKRVEDLESRCHGMESQWAKKQLL